VQPHAEHIEEFKEAFAKQLEDVTPKAKIRTKSKGNRIAFLGNFRDTYSTENELAWSMEYEGYEVDRLQEDRVRMDDLKDAGDFCDVFWWVRTPTFLKIADSTMDEFLKDLKDRKIPSLGFHLDRFWGIPEREALVGNIPFWHCEYLFTADGDNQRGFASRSVNHIYLPPGVALRGCYPGTPQDDLKVDVGFVGSGAGYHREYPQRAELIDFLTETYGTRFRMFNGYRGEALNNLYASIRVCVGDSCFANTGQSRNYFSDRVPETMGRFGVLTHPAMKGLLKYRGLLTHTPGDFNDLKDTIDGALANESYRKKLRNEGAEYIRRNHTYCHRVRMILSMVIGK
jgi:ribosomal protein S17E